MSTSANYKTISKTELTNYSVQLPDWQKTKRFALLEKKYGNLLYCPLDVPRIEADNLSMFSNWFFRKAIPIYKRKVDIADPSQDKHYLHPSFFSVDSTALPSVWKYRAWDINPVSDMYDHFPEIKRGILEHLPFECLDYYSLWSSIFHVSAHRDSTPICDAPFAFRINLYDSNPAGTLTLHKGLPDTDLSQCETHRVENLPDTNTFVWNNLRILHSSTKEQQYKKILMLVAITPLNVLDYDKFEVILDRSIEKYKNNLWIDTNTLSDYIDIDVKNRLISNE